MIWILVVILIVILVLFSAFFASAEMAFVSADRIAIEERALNGDKNAKILRSLLEKPDEVISAIVVGNNIVNISASILAGSLAIHIFGNAGVGIATAIMTLLIIIFGEATPKSFGINNTDFALRISKYLWATRKIFYPVAKAFSYISNAIVSALGKKEGRKAIVTENEIKAMLDLGVKYGTIEKDEKELVEEVFDFDETRAIEVYVPREKMVCLHEDDTIEELIKKAVETGYSRFPVYRDNLDDIVGMVHVKDALLKDGKMKVKEIMRDILKINPGMKIDDVLREMQRRKVHMAIIQSKEGRTLGIVTLEDLIEELFGEIVDEHDVK
ncbi:MAG: HlyC/CorC family transporter [Thermoplasmata archaeon]|nr:HlyC/CorC family transporter [Thermoplasmata archaeon]